MWISVDDIPCECGPSNMGCGAEEYPDKVRVIIRGGNGGQGVKIPLPKEQLKYLYWNCKKSLGKIAEESIRHFGIKISEMHVYREMKRLGIPRRGRGHVVTSENFILDPNLGI